jgi:acetyl-CoA carboxylase biotin carboxyl carrier protein
MYHVNEIRELVKMIDNSSIGELSIKTDNNSKITIKKHEEIITDPQPVKKQPIPKHEATKTVEKIERKEEKKVESVSSNQDVHEIASPMVGIFYRSPSPDDAPYVQVGDEVEENKVVCIVEAMKLFNEIEAEVKGEIVEVLVKNGELVEYGQPLFHVKKI